MPDSDHNLQKAFQKLIKKTNIDLSQFIIAEASSTSHIPDYDKPTMARFNKLIKGSITVEPRFQNTYVVAVATSSRSDDILRINCRGGTAIGGYVYDTLNDCYCVRGIDYITLGYIPIAFKITMEGGNWSTFVPITESVMQRYMNRQQKNDLRNFKDHYQNCKICFLQLVD